MMKGDKRKQRKRKMEISEENKRIAMEQVKRFKEGKKSKGVHKVNAGAVQYDEEDKQKIITGKLRDFLHKQRNFRSNILQKNEMEYNLEEIKYCLNICKSDDGDHLAFIEYDGRRWSYRRLQAHNDVCIDAYSNFVYDLENNRKELKEVYNLTDKQIINMVNNRKFIKEIPQLEKDDSDEN